MKPLARDSDKRTAELDGPLSAQLACMCLMVTLVVLCIYPICAESVACAVFRMGAALGGRVLA